MTASKLLMSVWLLAIGAALLAIVPGNRVHATPQNQKAAPRFVVVVNAKNDIKGDTKKVIDDIKKLFLRTQKQWSSRINGKPIEGKPFDRDVNSDAHKAMLTGILKISEAKLTSHWMKMKQKNGTTKPRAVKSSSSLIRFIKKYEGAFGIMTREEAEKAGFSLPTDDGSRTVPPTADGAVVGGVRLLFIFR